MRFRDTNRADLYAALEKLPRARFVVYGDYMLDQWVETEVTRLSPEAPVPIAQVLAEHSTPGGAGHVAMSLLALGADVACCGFIGEDYTGETLSQLLCEAGAGGNMHFLCSSPKVTTTTKTRIVAGGHHLLRVDDDNNGRPDPAALDIMRRRVTETVWEWCGEEFPRSVVISDYNKGSVLEPVVPELIAAARSRGVPVVGDPKPKNVMLFDGCDVLCPNALEFEQGPFPDAQVGAIIVTGGADGMMVIDPADHTPEHFSASATTVRDVCGAGDTVTALVSAGLAVGLSLHDAAVLANVAAGLAVAQPRCATVRLSELEDALEQYL